MLPSEIFHFSFFFLFRRNKNEFFFKTQYKTNEKERLTVAIAAKQLLGTESSSFSYEIFEQNYSKKKKIKKKSNKKQINLGYNQK